jgi:hypothetical protein
MQGVPPMQGMQGGVQGMQNAPGGNMNMNPVYASGNEAQQGIRVLQ